jgi:hypothetical protein
MSEAPPAVPPTEAPPQKRATPAALLRGLILTLICCGLFIYAGARPGYSVYAWLALLPVLPWLLYNLVRALVHAGERLRRLPKVALWVLAVAVVLAVQNHNEHAARTEADAVLAQLQAYHKRTNAWPAKLEDLGLDSQALHGGRWHITYEPASGAPKEVPLGDGAPHLFYAAPNMMRDIYIYDFDTRSWKYQSD